MIDSMLKRTYLGLEVRCRALHAVALQKKGRQVTLVGGQTARLDDGVIRPVFTGANVLQPDSFVNHLKTLLSPMVNGDKRIGVALPDSCGRLLLLDVETPFKNRTEGIEIVRWQLKDLVINAGQLAVDYQILEEKESGQKKILAAVIARDVLKHFEALIEQAGYAPALIDFHSMALYNAYCSKVDFGPDFVLLGLDGSQLSIQVFINRSLIFHRTRQVERDGQRVFQEVNRSLVGCRGRLSNFDRLAVYFHSDWVMDDLSDVVTAVFEQPVQWLTSPVKKLINGHQVNFSDVDVRSMAAALGVAERMMQGEG